MEKQKIQLHDCSFRQYISHQKILQRISEMALDIQSQKHSDNPIFLSVLNGAFMFTADLCKQLSCNPIVTFIKIASYSGTKSTGSLESLFGLDVDLKDKTVYILEDIIDSGSTVHYLYNLCKDLGAKEIFIVCLLFKPKAYKQSIPIFTYGFEIPNDFVVGYGMDYNGLGRNLKDIYIINEKHND